MGKGSGGGGTVVQGPSPEAARIAGEFQIQAAEKAAAAAKENTILAIEELRRQTEVGRADVGPQRLAGYGALDQLAQSLGLPTPEIGSAAVADLLSRNQGIINQGLDGSAADPSKLFDFSSINMVESDPSELFGMLRQQPGYQFRVDEGTKAINRAASASGLLNSGAVLKELQDFGQQTASMEFGNMQNRLAQLAGLGAGASNFSAGLSGGLGSGVAGQFGNLGNTIANAQLATGQARASSHLAANQQYQTIGGGSGLGGLGSFLGGAGSLIGAFKCSKTYKDHISEMEDEDLLAKLDRLTLNMWTYKGQDVAHVSPYAEDFHSLFGVGDKETIHPIDLFGILLASIKALSAKVKRLESEKS